MSGIVTARTPLGKSSTRQTDRNTITAVKPARRRFLPLISSSARVSLSRHTVVRLHFSSRGSIVVVAEFLTSNVLKSSRTDGTLAENWPGARLLGR